MAVDCGIELKKHNVTMLSLYPGAVKTELVTLLNSKSDPNELQTNLPRGVKQILAICL